MNYSDYRQYYETFVTLKAKFEEIDVYKHAVTEIYICKIPHDQADVITDDCCDICNDCNDVAKQADVIIVEMHKNAAATMLINRIIVDLQANLSRFTGKQYLQQIIHNNDFMDCISCIVYETFKIDNIVALKAILNNTIVKQLLHKFNVNVLNVISYEAYRYTCEMKIELIENLIKATYFISDEVMVNFMLSTIDFDRLHAIITQNITNVTTTQSSATDYYIKLLTTMLQINANHNDRQHYALFMPIMIKFIMDKVGKQIIHENLGKYAKAFIINNAVFLNNKEQEFSDLFDLLT